MIYPDPNMGNFSDLQENTNWKVMQYTGLDDANGIMIYEGDILQDTQVPDWRYEVLWGKYEWRMAMAGGMQVEMFRHRTNNGIHYQYKVIGNIYENPDLLK